MSFSMAKRNQLELYDSALLMISKSIIPQFDLSRSPWRQVATITKIW